MNYFFELHISFKLHVCDDSYMLYTKKEDTYVCKTSCLVSGSLVMYAVRPTALDPLPEVYWPRGTKLYTYWSSCDLLVPGSPHSRRLISALLTEQQIILILFVSNKLSVNQCQYSFKKMWDTSILSFEIHNVTIKLILISFILLSIC